MLQSLRLATVFRRQALALQQRRNAQTVPRLGTEAEMQAEAVSQIRARVAYQKELIKAHEHSMEEEIAEMWRWVNISFWVAIPVTILSGIYSITMDEHPHRVDQGVPEYMKIRSKEFPWQCGDCDFFDGKCWKQCRAEQS